MSTICAIIRLWSTGDFTPDMRQMLGEEDSPLVAFILTIAGR